MIPPEWWQLDNKQPGDIVLSRGNSRLVKVVDTRNCTPTTPRRKFRNRVLVPAISIAAVLFAVIVLTLV